jgi:hypothetical protein
MNNDFIQSKQYGKLPEEARCWLTCALDPYHDTAVRLEGLPDHSIGNSYVRVHNTALDITSTAEGDQIAVLFTGLHGCQANTKVTDCYSCTDVTGLTVRPIVVIRSNAGVEPNLTNYVAGIANRIGAVGCAEDGGVPSRLIGLAVEIHDTTSKLYQKGTITATHIMGNSTHFDVLRSCSPAGTETNQTWRPDYLVERQDVPPMLPGTLALLAQYPQVYTNQLAKGLYIVARLAKPKGPTRFLANIDTNGSGLQDTNRIMHSSPHAFGIREGANGTMLHLQRTSDPVTVGAWEYQPSYLNNEPGMVYSGFQPFIIRMSGLPAQGEYRMTVRSLIEYFPESSTVSELGIATPSPPVSTAALELYQRVMLRAPSAVPVGSNASGDYWRVIRSLIARYAPPLLSIGSKFAPPGAALAMNMAGLALRQVAPKKKMNKVSASQSKKAKLRVGQRRGPQAN